MRQRQQAKLMCKTWGIPTLTNFWLYDPFQRLLVHFRHYKLRVRAQLRYSTKWSTSVDLFGNMCTSFGVRKINLVRINQNRYKNVYMYRIVKMKNKTIRYPENLVTVIVRWNLRNHIFQEIILDSTLCQYFCLICDKFFIGVPKYIMRIIMSWKLF